MLAVGYVEGEYVQLAPVSSAELVEVAVRQGDRVATGQPVARQERTDAEIALAEAEAARAEAEAELANLREGSRPEEIAVTEAALEAAQVRLARGPAPGRAADRAGAAQRRQPGQPRHRHRRARHRPDRGQAAPSPSSPSSACRRARSSSPPPRAGSPAPRPRCDDARWRLDKRTLAAPVDGEVTDVFRRVGEIAGPTDAVVSILPDGA